MIQRGKSHLFKALLAGLCLSAVIIGAQGADEASTFSARTNHWAFQIPPKPALPILGSKKKSPANPIDRFLQQKLASLDLKPSPETDRHTLLRRVTFDLTGLPPTPGEVRAFEKDKSPDAYEKLVDRLLASPRYGERWARHWLDVVHFGETHGYDKDKLRPNAWPYRDYVIQAFNSDKPYSRFVQEQLAGDVLFPDSPEGIVATGFIAAGPWDYVGHVELPITKTDGLIARYLDRDDMVMTTVSTFQSLTVHCARCHNHKFDPITQKDYYALQSVFAGVDRANRTYDSDPAVAKQRRTLTTTKQSLDAQQAEVKALLAKLTSPELIALDKQVESVKGKVGDAKADKEEKSPSNGYHSEIESKPDAVKWVQVDLGKSVALDEVRLVPARPTDFADTPGFGFPVRFKVESADEATFAQAQIIADHTAADFKNPGDVAVNLETKGKSARYLRVTSTRLWERSHDYVFALGELQAFSGGTNAARATTVTALDSIEAGRWAKQHLVDGFSSRGRLSDITYTPEQLAQRRAWETEAKQLAADRASLFESLIPADVKANRTEIEQGLERVKMELAALPEPKVVFAGANDFKAEGSFGPAKGVRPVHLLSRGDVKRPGDLMAAAAVPAVPGPSAKFGLSNPDDEGARRAALAKWIADPKNLLTRRSIVNRVWQYHFGRGIVDSPNDFGHMGSAPTHPELLDWLAYWFMEQGESVKALHRLIVTTQAYRQVSQANNAQAATADADNRYLWRMNRTRLDAESIRDTMLSVSGQIDLTMGGPSDRQFFFKDDHSPVYDYTRFEVHSKAGHRRSIYRLLVRSVPDPFMDSLDCADPSQLVPKRNTTLTALQALATLNNPFVLRQCEAFAERLQTLGKDVNSQIEAAYLLALARVPTKAEKRQLTAFAKEFGLPNACRVIMNSTEFVFID